MSWLVFNLILGLLTTVPLYTYIIVAEYDNIVEKNIIISGIILQYLVNIITLLMIILRLIIHCKNYYEECGKFYDKFYIFYEILLFCVKITADSLMMHVMVNTFNTNICGGIVGTFIAFFVIKYSLLIFTEWTNTANEMNAIAVRGSV